MHVAVASQVSDDTLIAIFSTILDWHMTTQNFPDPIKALSNSLVAATLAVHSTAATKLLPTPTKSHYLFNLRDFARVVHVRVLRHAPPSRSAALVRCFHPCKVCR